MQFLIFVTGILSFFKTGFDAIHTAFSWVGSTSNTFGPMIVKAIVTGLTVASFVAHAGSLTLSVVAGVLTTIGSFASRL